LKKSKQVQQLEYQCPYQDIYEIAETTPRQQQLEGEHCLSSRKTEAYDDEQAMIVVINLISVAHTIPSSPKFLCAISEERKNRITIQGAVAQKKTKKQKKQKKVKREQQERVHAGSGRKKTKKKKKKKKNTREEVKKIKSSSLPPGYICYVRGSRITCVSK
jgi:hypothetical protein